MVVLGFAPPYSSPSRSFIPCISNFSTSSRRSNEASSSSSSSTPALSAKIAPIVDQISGLSLLEVSELVQALKVGIQSSIYRSFKTNRLSQDRKSPLWPFTDFKKWFVKLLGYRMSRLDWISPKSLCLLLLLLLLQVVLPPLLLKQLRWVSLPFPFLIDWSKVTQTKLTYWNALPCPPSKN